MWWSTIVNSVARNVYCKILWEHFLYKRSIHNDSSTHINLTTLISSVKVGGSGGAELMVVKNLWQHNTMKYDEQEDSRSLTCWTISIHL